MWVASIGRWQPVNFLTISMTFSGIPARGTWFSFCISGSARHESLLMPWASSASWTVLNFFCKWLSTLCLWLCCEGNNLHLLFSYFTQLLSMHQKRGDFMNSRCLHERTTELWRIQSSFFNKSFSTIFTRNVQFKNELINTVWLCLLSLCSWIATWRPVLSKGICTCIYVCKNWLKRDQKWTTFDLKRWKICKTLWNVSGSQPSSVTKSA